MTDPAGFQYCPICGREIEAVNRAEVAQGEHAGYLFVHDDIVHSENDMAALSRGIQ